MAKYKYLFLIPVILVILAFIYLFYLESFNYDNYVFATLHINLSRFAFVPGVFLGGLVLYYLGQTKTSLITKILAVIFCLVSVPVAIESVGTVAARTHQMFLGKSFIVQKYTYETFGNDYKFMEFVKRYLSGDKNITVILPPNQLPWHHTGNPEIMNSFLYPITTTNKYTKSPYVLISSEEDGAGYHLWPDFKIPAKTIIIYDWTNDKAITITGQDWDPAEWQNQKPWGLIIRKDI